MDTLLDSVRVLDLTDENGLFCGKILGDMGADVIVVEPPSGNPARRRGPFFQDIPHLEKSLFWFALNTNKRSITLNLENADGVELFKILVKNADFVIHTFSPHYLDKLGLNYEVLSKLNPALVMTSITPFGTDGPYAKYKSADIVLMGLGGLSYISGEPNREPLRIPVPQIYFHAGSWAAAASMIAFYHRQTTGEGQNVEISMQQASVWASYCTQEWWSYEQINLNREGTWRQIGNSKMQIMYPCKDGHVMLFVLPGAIAAAAQFELIEWMKRDGMCPDWLNDFDLSELDITVLSQDLLNRLSEALVAFFVTKTKAELFEFALQKKLFLAPVSNIKDLFENPQLQSRDFWINIEHPELKRSIIYPGPFAVLNETPIKLNKRAPLIGEHILEIFHNELGLSRKELVMLKQEGAI